MFRHLESLIPLAVSLWLGPAARGEAPLKVAVSWNLPVTPEGIRRAAGGAKGLGFNALAWSSKGSDAALAAGCRAAGLRSYKVVKPLEKRPGARLQVVEAGERRLPGFAATLPERYQYSGEPLPDRPELLRGLPAEYQWGGEPLPGHAEVLNEEIVCPLDRGVAAFVTAEVTRARQAGYDGVCWDYTGYRNYHSCECGACRAAFAAFMHTRPSAAEREAKAAFYAQVLVDLYARIYGIARKVAPALTVLTHCYPAFLPDPFYGREVQVDYCGITASWFFRPHWPLDKVREYALRTVRGPYRYGRTVGMPMIGCYSSGSMARHRKTGARLKEEFRALRDAGARAVMVCELGDILSDPEMREAVRAGLVEIR